MNIWNMVFFSTMDEFTTDEEACVRINKMIKLILE